MMTGRFLSLVWFLAKFVLSTSQETTPEEPPVWQPPPKRTWDNATALATEFGAVLVERECSKPDHGFDSVEECMRGMKKALQTAKVIKAYQMSQDLIDTITVNKIIPMDEGWQYNVEGNTFNYSSKVRRLQELADDQRVVRICEVGFNMGHSSTNWLLSNPIAQVLAFDIARTRYTPAAINAIYQLFPQRTINLVAGDSALTIPSFSRYLYGGPDSPGISEAKYNLIFIDGNHEFSGALLDIINLRAFANSTYHRVVIDDVHHPDVRRAWDYAADVLGIVRTIAFEPMEEYACTVGIFVEEGPLYGTMELVPCVKGARPTMFDALFVGEYVL